MLPILAKANVTIDLNGKNVILLWHAASWAEVYDFPHLGGVAASIGALNRAGSYTLARACASAL